jgi:hypothetical protein
MSRHRARRRGLTASFSSLQRPGRRHYSPLERFYLSLPWILIVCLGIVAGWSPQEIQGLVACLIPVVLLGIPGMTREVDPQARPA